MRTALLARALIGATLLLSAPAFAQQDLPAPVNGISFEEWTAGNARLANQQPLDEVLQALGVSEAQWKETNESFTKALSESEPGGPVIARYGEIFANPAVGRFKNRDDTPEIEAKLATYEDYARVQAHLTVGTEAGKDPQEILKEHDLTVYEFSQEAGNWVRQFAGAVDNGKIEEWNRIRDNYESEYRARYGLDTNDKF